MPSFFSIINYVQFSLAVMETGDTALLSFATYVSKRRGAHVSIVEIKTALNARVTIIDLRDGFNRD